MVTLHSARSKAFVENWSHRGVAMADSLIEQHEVRAAVVYTLVSRIGDVGKTQIQKLGYFLQEHYNVPLGCTFYIHQYGPYSDELDTAISNLKFMEYVSVTPDPQGYGFHVRPVSQAEKAWSGISDSVQDALNDLIGKLGKKDARELELLATIHDLAKSERSTKQGLVALVQGLKPKFSEQYISRKYDEMAESGLLP